MLNLISLLSDLENLLKGLNDVHADLKDTHAKTTDADTAANLTKTIEDVATVVSSGTQLVAQARAATTA